MARFPLPIRGRIPNFEGAHDAAEQLAEVDVWQDAKALKSNPDSPQRWTRRLALQRGKTVYMAVPRLTQVDCFLELDPKAISRPERASTIKGAFALGRPVSPERVWPLDLVLAGSVAVNLGGGRVGKGGGYSDIEYALGHEYGFLKDETPVVTTVHPLQLVDDDIPMLIHDIPVDYVATPKAVHKVEARQPKPRGIYWDILSEEKLGQIPILQDLRRGVRAG